MNPQIIKGIVMVAMGLFVLVGIITCAHKKVSLTYTRLLSSWITIGLIAVITATLFWNMPLVISYFVAMGIFILNLICVKIAQSSKKSPKFTQIIVCTYLVAEMAFTIIGSIILGGIYIGSVLVN